MTDKFAIDCDDRARVAVRGIPLAMLVTGALGLAKWELGMSLPLWLVLVPLALPFLVPAIELFAVFMLFVMYWVVTGLFWAADRLRGFGYTPR